jgi:protein-tyrosine phosphatase
VVELRRTLEVIAGEGELPLVFHCHAGKDRTGIVAALVLSLVGVDRADVIADFGLTNLATPKFLADMVARGRPVPAWPGFARAPEQAMRLFLVHLDERYGSVRGYVQSELGLTDDLIEAMKARLLD